MLRTQFHTQSLTLVTSDFVSPGNKDFDQVVRHYVHRNGFVFVDFQKSDALAQTDRLGFVVEMEATDDASLLAWSKQRFAPQ
jgi:hypothetical protein